MRFLPDCKKILISLLVVLFSLLAPMLAQAASMESGTLTIYLHKREFNVELAVYRVADCCDGEFALLPEFEEVGNEQRINLTQLKTALDIKKATDFFEKQINTQKISSAYQDYTSEGKLSLGEIPTGMYLVSQVPHKEDRVSVQSFLASVPGRNVADHGEGEESTLFYDVEAYPKEEVSVPEESEDSEKPVKTGDRPERKILLYGCICLVSGSMVCIRKRSKIQ